MRIVLAALLAGLPLLAQAEACIIHSQSNQLDVKLCQENRTIPQQLFRSGFCAPQLKGQKVDVSFAPQCPSSSYGVCRGAKVSGTPTWLLKLFWLAWVLPSAPSAVASISLVPVLPADPVTAITLPVKRARAACPSAIRASSGSLTRIKFQPAASDVFGRT